MSGALQDGQPGQDGWVRNSTSPYEVSRAKIVEFADAIADPNPVYRDSAAAALAGYSDVIAPPTFAVVMALPASIAAARKDLAGAGAPVIVHVDQRFDYTRPIQAGDVLDAESEVTSVREMRGTLMISCRTKIRTVSGEHVCTATMTLARIPGNG